MKRLAFNQQISLSAARKMIHRMAIYGDAMFRVQSVRDVEGVFASSGVNLDVIAAECRHFFRGQVPLFENLLGSTWKATGNVGVVDDETGKELESLSEAGWVYTSTYQNGFTYAMRVLHRGVKASDPNDINSAVVHGITALDAFLLLHADRWNSEHPDDHLLDTRKNKTSFEGKVKEWLPKLCGKPFPRDGEIWRDYQYLKSVRHDEVIHPKSNAGVVTLDEIAKRVNTFRNGIAEFLCRLHILLNTVVPSGMIRACFTPDCVVVDDEIST